jgi:hypothetical protein
MITIFCDFRQFSAKIFSKTNVMIKIFASFSFVLSQKRQFFAKFFGENIQKIVTSVPGWTRTRGATDASASKATTATAQLAPKS